MIYISWTESFCSNRAASKIGIIFTKSSCTGIETIRGKGTALICRNKFDILSIWTRRCKKRPDFNQQSMFPRGVQQASLNEYGRCKNSVNYCKLQHITLKKACDWLVLLNIDITKGIHFLKVY